MTLPGCKGNTYISKARKFKFFPQTKIVLKTKTFDQKEKLLRSEEQFIERQF